MWRPIHSVFVSLSLLASGGCNSTLDEYRCTEASNCVDSVSTTGRCEPSGHCSFADMSCLDSGFRFGGNSGDESGQCVSADPGDVDAGLVDARTDSRPIARISPTEVGVCGVSLTADGSGSEAFNGATIESYTWTLAWNGEEIDTFTGTGDTPLERGLHRLGGDYRAPEINLPSYHGTSALRAEINTAMNQTTVFQSGFEVSSQPYRLFFAIGMGADVKVADPSVTVRFATSIGSLTIGEFEVVAESFTGHTIDMTVPGLPGVIDAILLFEFEGDGERWLDNIALVETQTGNVITQNESFESLDDNTWALGDGTGGEISSQQIPASFREDETYVVRLQVTDTNQLTSETTEIQVNANESCRQAP